MRRRLPPLNAVRAFEAAARHMSFKLAARELSVTPQAVSHQIKVLEAYLRAPVFVRGNRSIELTPVGAAFLPTVRQALGDLAEAAAGLVARGADVLTINATPAFAVRWLIPRLGDFQRRYPDLDYRLTAMVELPDLELGVVDVAIHWGDPQDRARFWVEHLMDLEVVPVVSPALLPPDGRVEGPRALGRFTLIHHMVDPGCWQRWFQAAGVDDVDAEHGPRFESNLLMLEAAAAGVGVCLVAREDAERDLRAGRLVVPVDVSIPHGFDFYLICARARRDEPKIAEFRRWLRDAVIPGRYRQASGARSLGSDSEAWG